MLHIENTGYKFSKHDKTIQQIIIALNNLIVQPPKTKRIGFNAGDWQCVAPDSRRAAGIFLVRQQITAYYPYSSIDNS